MFFLTFSLLIFSGLSGQQIMADTSEAKDQTLFTAFEKLKVETEWYVYF